jgi:two-component system, NarL family, sensor histidine kinase UhpB
VPHNSEKDRLRSIASYLPVVLWEIDAKGIITLSEGKALSAMGLEPGELVGRSIFDLYPDRPDFSHNTRRALAGEAFSTVADVGDRILESSFLPKSDENGKTIGMVGVAVDITEHIRMQRTVAGLSRRLWAVLEEERGRIAREIHDEAGQTMTALKLLIDRAHSSKDHEESRTLLVEATSLCGTVLEALRRISRDLRPGGVDIIGLRPSIAVLVERFERAAGISAQLFAPETLPEIDPDAQAAIYRFIQEALTNVTRHAQATRVDVRIEASDKGLVVETVDDGLGFIPAAALAGAGLGLIGMKERSRMLGGRLVIDSAPGRGTRVRLELPLPIPATAPGAG